MKKALPVLMILGLASSAIGAVVALNASPIEVKAGSGPTAGGTLPKVITLKDNTDAEIRSYYSSLNDLPQFERQGTNLLKNLRTIIHDLTYYSYDNCWKIYEITDREWKLSPASEDAYGSYNAATNTYTNYVYSSSNTNTKNNPYVHTLYRNRDANGVTVENGRIREWGDHSQQGGTNREHVWCQSRGFKASNGANGPAGTDVHHLMSGDGYVNGVPHNNNPYGYVDPKKVTINSADKYSYCAGNLAGSPLHPHSDDKSDIVFEPQDSDKGDIARACFYMAACYNNLSGKETITQYDPNLIMADYATDSGNAEDSSATHPVAMGILSDMLEWNRLDPVDEFEIHRNNLIYNNYQHNRNPFVDFPQWADYIWGDPDNIGTPTGAADPSKNSINAKEPDPSSSSSESSSSQPSSESSSSEIPSSESSSSEIPSSSESSSQPSSSDSSQSSESSSSIFIEPALELSTTSLNLKPGESAKVSGNSSDGSAIEWSTSDESIVSISAVGPVSSRQEVTITALKEGKATITASCDFPNGQNISKFIDVVVKEEVVPSSSTPASSSPESSQPPVSSSSGKQDFFSFFGCNSSISAFGIGGIAIIGAIASFVLFKKKD